MSLDFGKKLRTIQPHFEKHGSYLKKECMCWILMYNGRPICQVCLMKCWIWILNIKIIFSFVSFVGLFVKKESAQWIGVSSKIWKSNKRRSLIAIIKVKASLTFNINLFSRFEYFEMLKKIMRTYPFSSVKISKSPKDHTTKGVKKSSKVKDNKLK